MTKKKMNRVIAVSVLILYIICTCISFKVNYQYVGTEFSNYSENYINFIIENIFDFQNEENIKSVADFKKSIEESTSNCFYPSVYCVFDKNGKEVFKTVLYKESNVKNKLFSYVNEKIVSDLENEYSEKNFQNLNFSGGGSGGNGFYGSEYFTYSETVNLNGERYYFAIGIKHNLFCDTMRSSLFFVNAVNQSLLFLAVGAVMFVALNKWYDKNEQLNNARQAFTSAAAHELKTPITVINNQCECLMENVNPDKREEYVSEIYRQNRHMSALVGSLLQYNRIDFAELDKTEFALKDVCVAELSKYEALIESKNISVNTSKLFDDFIVADKKLITLVVDNFISNAVKHTPCGKEIRIGFDKWAGFSIYNDGEHIADDDKDKIWEAFNRSAGDEVIESSGMGLAVCKKILDAHKFDYGFNNLPNGVEFYFKTK